jgi:hypothetical protein
MWRLWLDVLALAVVSSVYNRDGIPRSQRGPPSARGWIPTALEVWFRE